MAHSPNLFPVELRTGWDKLVNQVAKRAAESEGLTVDEWRKKMNDQIKQNAEKYKIDHPRDIHV